MCTPMDLLTHALDTLDVAATPESLADSDGHHPPRARVVAVLVGLPGAGKSTFAAALGSTTARAGANGRGVALPPGRSGWIRISQDVLGKRPRCEAAAKMALAAGFDVVVDRCNFDAQQRSHWLHLAKDGAARIVAVHLQLPMDEASVRAFARESHEGGVDRRMGKKKVAKIVSMVNKGSEPPTNVEGFTEVLVVTDDASRDEALARLRVLTVG